MAAVALAWVRQQREVIADFLQAGATINGVESRHFNNRELNLGSSDTD
jgi:hypothetical protein